MTRRCTLMHTHKHTHTHSLSTPTKSEWWTDQPDKPVRIRYGTSPVTSEPPETVLQLFERIVGSHGDHHALGVKRQGEWKMCSYKFYYEQACTAAKAFIEVGKEGGREGDNVILDSHSSWVWIHSTVCVFSDSMLLSGISRVSVPF